MKPYYSHGGITIYHGDCREVLPGMTGADLVVSDPPYGTGGWRRPATGAGGNPMAQLVREEWDDGAVEWVDGSVPVVTFWSAGNSLPLLRRASAVGLVKHRMLYMHKRDPKPQVAGRIAWSIEPIWALSRDGFVLRGGTDWFSDSTPRLGRDADATGHPYQKPIEVMRWLVDKTEGTVLDPFMGSGTTLRAAKDLGRRAIGIEIEERYCEIAAKRLSQEVLDFGGGAA